MECKIKCIAEPDVINAKWLSRPGCREDLTSLARAVHVGRSTLFVCLGQGHARKRQDHLGQADMVQAGLFACSRPNLARGGLCLFGCMEIGTQSFHSHSRCFSWPEVAACELGWEKTDLKSISLEPGLWVL